MVNQRKIHKTKYRLFPGMTICGKVVEKKKTRTKWSSKAINCKSCHKIRESKHA